VHVRPLIASALAIALTLAPIAVPVAHAEPTAADLESARDLFKKGKELRDKGDLKGALEKFKAAHALAGTPITGLELGKTHLAANELVEARDAFLSVGRIPAKSKESENAHNARAEAAKLAADLKPRIPAINVSIKGAPPANVKLTIDGILIPPAAIGEPRRVNPGKHVIVGNAGGEDARAEVDVAESEEKSVTLEVKAPAEPVAAPVSEKPVPAPTTAAPAPLPPTKTDTDSGGLGAATWIGLGLTGVGLMAGSITGALALSKARTAKDRCVNNECPPDVHDDVNDGKLMGNISTVSFAVAGVGVVVTIIGLVTKPKATQTGSIHPLIGFGSVGVGGEF